MFFSTCLRRSKPTSSAATAHPQIKAPQTMPNYESMERQLKEIINDTQSHDDLANQNHMSAASPADPILRQESSVTSDFQTTRSPAGPQTNLLCSAESSLQDQEYYPTEEPAQGTTLAVIEEEAQERQGAMFDNFETALITSQASAEHIFASPCKGHLAAQPIAPQKPSRKESLSVQRSSTSKSEKFPAHVKHRNFRDLMESLKERADQSSKIAIGMRDPKFVRFDLGAF